MPAAPLRVATENNTASAVNASDGGSVEAHASPIRASAAAGITAAPDRSTSGAAPKARRPAATLLAASTIVATQQNAMATITLPAKISARLQERVSSVGQLRSRSSDEKRSPATMLLRTGKA